MPDMNNSPKGKIQVSNSNIYMIFAGREVRIGKNCALGREYGSRPAASGRNQDRGTVFLNTDRPRPANNVFIFFFRRILCKQFLC